MEQYLMQFGLVSLVLIMGIAVYYIFKKMIFPAPAPVEDKPNQETLKIAVLPLKAQAYERMLLLVDRIHPKQLVLRNSSEDLNALNYQHLLIQDLQAEFQHNIAQFLYLSPSAVQILRKLKADTIQLIQTQVVQLPASATGKELALNLILYMSDLQDSPYDYATDFLQHDFQKDFTN
ncbi:MAG: hypothetical protein EOO99_03655 [Pedobacter sp.]|nr:MAG: hypothetical protein EOO99_03655 [Pedobacter sp.]